jgi:hypothetical protein
MKNLFIFAGRLWIMSDFANRMRMTLEQAQRVIDAPSNRIRHILKNDDDTYSIMGHIVCEFCDYCDEGGIGPFTAKENPYELSESEI